MSKSIPLSMFAVAVAGFAGLACDPPTKPTPFAVNQVAPTLGSREGGTNVVIYGTGFKEPVSVYFGDQPGKVGAVGRGTVNVTSPPGSAIQVDVRVVNGTGDEATLRGAFSYADFTIIGVTPESLLVYETLTIRGTGIPPKTQVSIGSMALDTYPSGEFALFVNVLPLAPGPYDVTVKTPSGTTITLPEAVTVRRIPLTAIPTAVAAGGALSVSWSEGRVGVNAFDGAWDYIGLFRVGASNDSPLWREDVIPSSGTFTLTAPQQPGDYEFRFLTYSSPFVAGRSETISVSVNMTVQR